MQIKPYLGVEIILNHDHKFISSVTEKPYGSYASIVKAIRELIKDNFEPFDVINRQGEIKTILGWYTLGAMTNEGIIYNRCLRDYFKVNPELVEKINTNIRLTEEMCEKQDEARKAIAKEYKPLIPNIDDLRDETSLLRLQIK